MLDSLQDLQDETEPESTTVDSGEPLQLALPSSASSEDARANPRASAGKKRSPAEAAEALLSAMKQRKVAKASAAEAVKPSAAQTEPSAAQAVQPSAAQAEQPSAAQAVQPSAAQARQPSAAHAAEQPKAKAKAKAKAKQPKEKDRTISHGQVQPAAVGSQGMLQLKNNTF